MFFNCKTHKNKIYKKNKSDKLAIKINIFVKHLFYELKAKLL